MIKPLTVDRSLLPPGDYTVVGFDSRQVFDIDIRRVVIEYQAEILENQQGQRFTAPFPAGVTKAVQYGNGVKAQSVYLSQYQLIPYNRVQEHFQEQLDLPISEGSIFTYNQQAYELLEQFEQKLIVKLLHTRVIHADESVPRRRAQKVKALQCSYAAQEMGVGPSESPYRRRLQTTYCCCV